MTTPTTNDPAAKEAPVMYQNIFVPVDNSPHSNRAIDHAVGLGSSFGSTLTGCHVYAAKMHDYRFKQMEYTLPEEYLVEQELHRQRKIHDSLITMGLELISDCYLESMEQQCREAGVGFASKMMDGKHSTELIREIDAEPYDLVVLGAVGIGRTKDTQIGSVCARVVQQCDKDVWVVRHVPGKDEPERDTILVGVDGSPKSFGALMTAIELAKRFGKKLEVVGVYDPYLHYAVFKGIVEVLTEKAAKIFRFEEQNQLHEEIIDTGLAQIYQSHINVAEAMARDEGVEVTKTLLDGKAFQKVLDHVRRVDPWLLVIGRSGVHSPADEADALGSNTENLLRLAPCDLLITRSEVVPELDLKAEESIHWTPEAEERMGRVPDAVKGIARTAILRLALEQGHSVVSSDLVTEAMERFMPKRSAAANVKLAEALVVHQAERQGESVAICASCGIAARTPDPVTCTVCGGDEFERVSPEEVARIIAEEGGVEEETTYDGRKIRWTQESRRALRSIEDRYQRRRAKARIEKAARGQRLDPISLEFAQRFVEEETGVLYTPASQPVDEVEPAATAADAAESLEDDPELKIVARDGKNVPLVSTFEWSDEAIERILRVPAGFMRDRTQGRVEELAGEGGATVIDLGLVEGGIEAGHRMMEQMIAEQEGAEPATAAASVSEPAAEEAGCPFAKLAAEADPEAIRRALPLNEVSVVTEMERRRQGLTGSDGDG